MKVETYEEFFTKPFTPGRFWWTETGASMLLQWGETRGEHLMLYTNHAPNNWARKGNIAGWSGGLDRPTLSPSIGVWNDDETAFVFHGFLEDGVLRSA